MEKVAFTVEEVASILSLGRNKTYELVKMGIIPSMKLGKQIRIPKLSLESWLAEQTIKKAQ